MLGILYLLSWIIFVGICIDTGGFIFNAVYWLISKPVSARYLWGKADLLSLYNYDRGYFFVMMLFSAVAGILKAWMFYLIIKILRDKKLETPRPFNRELGRFVFTMSFFALVIGLFSALAGKYADWLAWRGVLLPKLEDLRLAGADVWLFMGLTLFVIAHIFKRGIEIQAENDLTI